ncbi:hypothetical protein PPIS_b1242 [Pseudoalteromonas piscicida]|uniref:Uncharacterized protein n=1 Tax=Pseudoalteromonas piscicida TaxID=43662 RepID=A0ABM6NMX3_PSEO7|nr:hypothetical protein PPIS_b1242 [Pseudoalteromonas piscicida]
MNNTSHIYLIFNQSRLCMLVFGVAALRSGSAWRVATKSS